MLMADDAAAPEVMVAPLSARIELATAMSARAVWTRALEVTASVGKSEAIVRVASTETAEASSEEMAPLSRVDALAAAPPMLTISEARDSASM